MIERAASAFESIFAAWPTCAASAPGRVEILGNHTDYNGGLVLAAAIDRHICIVGAPLAGNQAVVHSLNFDQRIAFAIPDPNDPPPPRIHVDWADLMRGALYCLTSAGVRVPAFSAVLLGDVPVAAGVSSSAALTVATAMLVLRLAAVPPSHIGTARLAQLMQQAEHVGLGVRCGLLDPYTSIHGKKDALIVLDAAAATGETVPLGLSNDAPDIVIVDSKSPRTLASSHYNQRRAECERAVQQLAAALARPVRYLCEVTPDELAQAQADLDDVALKRARHVIREHDRVRRAVAALQSGDIEQLGQLMRLSHASSRTDFENSTERLDLICEVADHHPACIGSRLTGAGWGGCTVHLVERGTADDFKVFMSREVRQRSGVSVDIHVTRASGGAGSRLLGGWPTSSEVGKR